MITSILGSNLNYALLFRVSLCWRQSNTSRSDAWDGAAMCFHHPHPAETQPHEPFWDLGTSYKLFTPKHSNNTFHVIAISLLTSFWMGRALQLLTFTLNQSFSTRPHRYKAYGKKGSEWKGHTKLKGRGKTQGKENKKRKMPKIHVDNTPSQQALLITRPRTAQGNFWAQWLHHQPLAIFTSAQTFPGPAWVHDPNPTPTPAASTTKALLRLQRARPACLSVCLATQTDKINFFFFLDVGRS